MFPVNASDPGWLEPRSLLDSYAPRAQAEGQASEPDDNTDPRHSPGCGAVNAKEQITIWQWFRLPKAERQWRATEFHAADLALQAYQSPGREEDETYLRLNARVNDLWPTVPRWCRW